MKRFFSLLFVFLLCFTLCACGTKTVEITEDNWDTYFEFRIAYHWGEESPFGDPPSILEYPLALCVKEQYEDRILMDQVDLAIECSWVENERVVKIDWEDREMVFGDVIRQVRADVRMTQTTEIQKWESYSNAYIVFYLRDLGVSAQELQKDADGNTYAVSMDNAKVTRIKGTIKIKN